jgi:hypothetical protein
MEPPTRPSSRRRWIAGLAAGLVLGAVTGAELLTQATVSTQAGPRPTVLHAAPALVRADAAVDLALSTFCEAPDAPTCDVTGATILVRPDGADGQIPIEGAVVEGVLRFHVPADLVPDGGFAYAFRVATADGSVVPYPPGADAWIRVVTTHGLPLAELPSFDWDDRAAPSATVLRLRVGSGPRQIGLAGVGEEGGASGPSSFDVAPDGSLLVADWVHARALRFGPDGTFRGSIALPPGRPWDIATTGNGLVAVTLGTDAQAVEIGADGRVAGRYPVGYGVVSRISGGPVPRVRVGSGQWIPVRGAAGAALPPAAQAAAQTSTVPLADGSVALTSVVGDRLAVVWTRPDGSRAGAELRLPAGVRAGADYFVRALDDGGALAVQGLWDDTHFAVAAIRLDARGGVVSLRLLPEPTRRMAAPFSTVRPGPDGSVLMARDLGDGLRIDRYEVR